MSEYIPEDQEPGKTEVVDSGAIAVIERAQIDIQIATAREYPRKLSIVKDKMLSFATLDEETAAGCFFTLPARKSDGKGDDDEGPIQGPSVRMAEIALSCYGHINAGVRIIKDDGKFITAQAVVHDLENNVRVAIEVMRSVTKRNGQRFKDHMVVTTANAACSIALRNATFRVVPRALITPVYEAAKRVAVGEVKSLTAHRAKVIDRLKQMGAKEDRILNAVGAAKVEDIDLKKLEILIGLGTSIKEGSIRLEEAFPAVGADESDSVPTMPEAKRAPQSEPKHESPPQEPKREPEPPAQPETPPQSNGNGAPSLPKLQAIMDAGGYTWAHLSELCNTETEPGVFGRRKYIEGAQSLEELTEEQVIGLLTRPRGLSAGLRAAKGEA